MSEREPHEDPALIRLQRVEQDNAAIRERIHELSNVLQPMGIAIAEIQADMKSQSKTLDKLDMAIDGNGKPGIKDILNDVKARLDRHDAWIGVWNKMLLVFGTSLVGLTVAALWKVITLTSK